jgi:hypothetical protein
MVLENISTSADFTDDGGPTSDNDPYSSSSPQSYSIDGTKFPKPIPIVGRLLGFNEKRFSLALQAKIAGMSQQLNRPLSNDEANAIAYWTAKQISIFSYATPLAWAAAGWRWKNTASSFRFPFYQPNMETLDTSVFPTKRFAWIKGHFAFRLWSAMRLGAYIAVAVPIAQALLGSYCVSVAAVGQMADNRLKPMMDELRKQAEEKRGGLPKQSGAIGQQQRLPVPVETQADDASPTGGMLWEEPVKADVMNNTISSAQAPSSRPQWTSSKPLSNQTTSTSSTEGKPFDLFDDASPTGGQEEAVNTPSAAQGSAWERLRRGERPNPGPSNTGSSQSSWKRQQTMIQKEQTPGSNSGDSFAFSKSEEERNYAKEEAQKEFDARVERERRGGDFSQDGGNQKRW